MKTSLIIIVQLIISVAVPLVDSLPWWTFLVPIFLLGFIFPLDKWNVKAFLSAFIAGFSAWLGVTFYFESIYDGQLLGLIARVIELSSFLLYVLIGLIGGTLTGLAFYAGYLLRKGREELVLELIEDKSVK